MPVRLSCLPCQPCPVNWSVSRSSVSFTSFTSISSVIRLICRSVRVSLSVRLSFCRSAFLSVCRSVRPCLLAGLLPCDRPAVCFSVFFLCTCLPVCLSVVLLASLLVCLVYMLIFNTKKNKAHLQSKHYAIGYGIAITSDHIIDFHDLALVSSPFYKFTNYTKYNIKRNATHLMLGLGSADS